MSGQYGRWPCCAWGAFRVEKLLTNSPREIFGQNYWLPPDKTQAGFVLDLGCEQILNMVELVNTHSGSHRDRGTKEFKAGFSLPSVSR